MGNNVVEIPNLMAQGEQCFRREGPSTKRWHIKPTRASTRTERKCPDRPPSGRQREGEIYGEDLGAAAVVTGDHLQDIAASASMSISHH